MESKICWPFSQDIGPCPEPHESSLHPPVLFLSYAFRIIACLFLGLPSGFFSSWFHPTCCKQYSCPMHATYLICLIIHHVIILTMFRKKYQTMRLLIILFSPSSCHFLPLRFCCSQHPAQKHPIVGSAQFVRDQISHPCKTTGRL